ncbi:hypothetical protein ABV409_11205 [Flagellimonas sp. DF-77]|uniref:hypothetical protein n=1 Tax=Flagellimonas algarum TaxID=3230298 RepID=UPI00339934F9
MSGFELQLTGGHPNSLGNTVAVVESVLEDPTRFEELFNCYFSEDEVVRLRVSNAMKRLGKADIGFLLPYVDRFLEEISKIDQASTQWTLSQLFLLLEKELDAGQREKVQEIMKNNLAGHTDWIVLCQTMETLSRWAKKDQNLAIWLVPHLDRLENDPRNSVSKKAKKVKALL